MNVTHNRLNEEIETEELDDQEKGKENGKEKG